MYTLFISDLHLGPVRPRLTEIFLNFLTSYARQADALYILGDFFEAWLGDDVETDFTTAIISGLRSLTGNGIPVYVMHGNRDFLLGQRFLSQSGCQLLADPTVISLYGTPTLLMHGDTLCWQDTSYLRFRKIARNPVYQRLFLSLPLFIRRSIAHYLRQQSSIKNNTTAAIELSDATPEAILQAIQHHNAELLIHGHTHRPGLQIQLEPFFKRAVLSDWEDCGNALLYSPDHTYRLVYFTQNSHKF